AQQTAPFARADPKERADNEEHQEGLHQLVGRVGTNGKEFAVLPDRQPKGVDDPAAQAGDDKVERHQGDNRQEAVGDAAKQVGVQPSPYAGFANRRSGRGHVPRSPAGVTQFRCHRCIYRPLSAIRWLYQFIKSDVIRLNARYVTKITTNIWISAPVWFKIVSETLKRSG